MIKKFDAVASICILGKLGIVNDHKILPQEDCNAIKDDVFYLLTFADENLKALETKPEGTSNFV